METKIRSQKGEIKRLYKITLDTLINLDPIPYHTIDSDGSNKYGYANIKPEIDDDEFMDIMLVAIRPYKMIYKDGKIFT